MFPMECLLQFRMHSILYDLTVRHFEGGLVTVKIDQLLLRKVKNGYTII